MKLFFQKVQCTLRRVCIFFNLFGKAFFADTFVVEESSLPDVVFKFLSTARRGIFHTDGEEWKFYALVVDFLNHSLTKFFCRHENTMGVATRRQGVGVSTPKAWR